MKIKKAVSIMMIGALLAMCSGCAGKEETVEKQKETPAPTQDVSGASVLKDAYANDFKFGVAIDMYQLEDKEIVSFIKEHFNSITMGNAMKPDSLLDQRGSEESEDGMPAINEERLDEILSLAKENGLAVRGHCLVWHNQTPPWFFCEDYEASNPKVDKETMRARLEGYIKKVLTYCQENYPGVVYAWDVVNEACEDGGGYRTKSNWYETYGDESYIEDAFTFAKKYAADDVKLFYNDYNEYDSSKMETIYELLKKLADKKLVDGMGFQSHWDLSYPSEDMIATAIETYSRIEGLEIQFTEIDMHTTANDDEIMQTQAERYRRMMEVILKADREGKANITNVTFWGLNDEGTWLTSFRGEVSYPLLFDADNQKKPCYDALMEVAK